MGTTGVAVWCPSCGPGVVDACLVERHRDGRYGYGFVTFVCSGCADVIASSCPALDEALVDLGVPVRRLDCSSPPTTGCAAG